MKLCAKKRVETRESLDRRIFEASAHRNDNRNNLIRIMPSTHKRVSICPEAEDGYFEH